MTFNEINSEHIFQALYNQFLASTKAVKIVCMILYTTYL